MLVGVDDPDQPDTVTVTNPPAGADRAAPLPKAMWWSGPEAFDPERPTVADMARMEPSGFALPPPVPPPAGYGRNPVTFYRDRPGPVPTPEQLAAAPVYITGSPADDDVSPWAERMRAIEETRPDGCPCTVGVTEDGQATARVISDSCPVHGGGRG